MKRQFKAGDIVKMAIKCTKENIEGQGDKGVLKRIMRDYNGDIGLVISAEGDQCTIAFKDRKCVLARPSKDLRWLKHDKKALSSIKSSRKSKQTLDVELDLDNFRHFSKVNIKISPTRTMELTFDKEAGKDGDGFNKNSHVYVRISDNIKGKFMLPVHFDKANDEANGKKQGFCCPLDLLQARRNHFKSQI